MEYNKNAIGEMINPEYFVSTPPPPTPKFVNGYLYIVQDEKFPEAVKIGRTSDMGKRLQGYNSDQPYDTTFLHCISQEFVNVHRAEKAILDYMKKIAEPFNMKKEWYAVEHLATLEQAIKDCEGYYELIPNEF